MFKNMMTLGLATAATCAFSSVGFAAPSNIDVVGQARFVSEAPVEKIVGTAPVKGGFSIDFEKPDTVKGEFKVPVSKMKTGNETRDEHLRGAEWLNAAKCPNITFRANSGEVKDFKPSDKRGIASVKLMVKGEMTINCVTQPMSATVVLKKKNKMARVGGKFEIKLADFKVAGKKGVVGKKVGETIQVALNLKNAK